MKLELRFEGNGKKILAGVAALVVIIAGTLFWQSGSGKRELEQSMAQTQQNRQAHDQEVKDYLFSGKRIVPEYDRVIDERALPLINAAKKFEKDLGVGTPYSSFGNVAERSALNLSLAAMTEFKRAYGISYGDIVRSQNRTLTQEERDFAENLGRKYADIFEEWFDPRWEQVQKAGPGQASWDLKFEPIK